jgi:glycosyltransferase involved in cell wall biosynthesis
MRVKVVMLIESLDRGGAESFTTALATGLDADRFDVTVCLSRATGRAPQERLAAAGVRLLQLPRRSRSAITAWAPLIAHLRREQTHVLHGHMFGANAWASLIGRMARVPVVVATEHSWSYSGRIVRRLVDGFVIGRLADAFIAVSQADARSMATIERVPRGKIRVIETAVPSDPERAPRSGRRIRRELDLDLTRPLIVAAASLTPAKRLDVLIRALGAVRGEPSPMLAIAGDGPERGSLERLTRELAIGDRVRLLGHRSDVPDLLAAATAFALSSGNEGTPLALIEAMHAGVPIAATAVGGIPAMLDGGTLGRLSPPGDATALARSLESIMSDPQGAARMAARAAEVARTRFSMSRAITEWQDLYVRLTERALA